MCDLGGARKVTDTKQGTLSLCRGLPDGKCWKQSLESECSGAIIDVSRYCTVQYGVVYVGSQLYYVTMNCIWPLTVGVNHLFVLRYNTFSSF